MALAEVSGLIVAEVAAKLPEKQVEEGAGNGSCRHS